MNREDNTVSVLQKAISYYGIKVTNNTIKGTLKSSSFYPSFRSICDALTEWKVDHFALKYYPTEIRDLNSPYITHFNNGAGQIAFVTGYENGSVIFYDSYQTKKKIRWDEYVKKISGAIIVLNPDENSGEKDYAKKMQEELLERFLIPTLSGVVALIISLLLINKVFLRSQQIPWQQYVLLFTKFVGIFFSAMLLMKEYEIDMPFAEKLCHISKKINCNSVLNDKAAMVFGPVGWADVGMIYFLGSFLVMLQGNFQAFNGFLVVVSILSLPYTIFSVWYQGLKLKKWCPFCIMVQVILVAELLIHLSFLPNAGFTPALFTNFVITFLAVGVIQILLTMYMRESGKAKFTYGKLQKFKKNPDIFRTLLFGQKHNDIKTSEKSLLFGKLDSGLRITAFLSPHCSHCGGAYAKIVDLLKSGSVALVNIVLIGVDSKILDTLHHLLKNCKEDDALSMLDQWYKSDHLERSTFQDNYCLVDAEEVSGDINTENNNLMKDCEVTGTPTFFINGYRLPSQYELDDIKYFVEIFNKNEVLT